MNEKILGGLVFPKAASILGIVYMAGRTLHTIGYLLRGPTGRIIGSMVSDLAMLGLCGTAIAAGVNWKKR